MKKALDRISLFLGGFRGLFVPFGLFALVAIGIHVGTDRLDDHLFVLFNAIDATLDEAAAWTVRAVFGWFDAAPSTIDVWTYRAVDLVDVELKQHAAQIGALVAELGADVALALPVFLHRGEPISPAAFLLMLRNAFRDPTVLKFSGPIATLLAALAGVFAIVREVQVATHSLVLETGLSAETVTPIASVFGLVALVVVTWRLGAPVVEGSVEYAHRRSSNDVTMLVPKRQRRMRGWITAALALPIAVLAVAATPIAGTLRALLSV